MKTIIILLALVLVGCANGTTDRFLPTTYTQVSSTCNGPKTDLAVFSDDAFDVERTIFKLDQKVVNSTCKLLTDGVFTIDGNTMITEFTQVRTTGECLTSDNLIWEEAYTIIKTEKTITLSSNSCSTVYERQ